MTTHVVLGGSKAAGRSTPLSDWDLLVVSDDYPRSHFEERYAHLGQRVDVEHLTLDKFNLHLLDISKFEVNLSGARPHTSHAILRFMCRMHAGEVLERGLGIQEALQGAVRALQSATAAAAASHYFNLLEDMVGWDLTDRREEFVVNAIDLFQRACLVFALHRALVDPSLKWAWFWAQQVANGAERDLIGRVFHLLDHVRARQVPLNQYLSYIDSIICMGIIGHNHSHSTQHLRREGPLPTRVFLGGGPGLRVGFDITTKEPYVLSDLDLRQRIQINDAFTARL